MDENILFGQISALRDELDRLNAQIAPGNYNRVSPQKKKGDLAIWGNKKSQRLEIGENGQVLIVDPVAEGGVKWADPSELVGAAPLIVPFSHLAGTDTVWTIPAAAGFLFGEHNHVTLADLSNYTECRLIVNKQGTNGSAGSIVSLKYRTAFSTTASDYSTIGTSAVSCDVAGVNNVIVSSGWISLAEAAKADVYLAVIGSGGDGATPPEFGSIVGQFR